ncbi:MAG: Hsp20/alpha crystallin family protein [Nitrospirae bacterium]|nr:Hsp20/alpha crystallin family protein [Nitrospirota bacterium]
MTKKKAKDDGERAKGTVEGIFSGLSDLVGRLGELADKGERLRRTGEFYGTSGGKDLKGVYGFSVKVGLNDEEVKVEPFGNIRKDETTGRSVVQELREPMVDIFDEEDYTLIVAEMPGIGAEDLRLDVQGDRVVLAAEKGAIKYRKEVLLSGPVTRDKMTVVCNNGIAEIKCLKS